MMAWACWRAASHRPWECAVSTTGSPLRYGTDRPPPVDIARRSCPAARTPRTSATMASQTCARWRESTPEPICMCRPTRSRPCCLMAASAAGRSVCQMPCLLCSPPVLVLWLWPWPKPGLMRSHTAWPGERGPSWCSMSIEPAFTGTRCSMTQASVAASNRWGVKTICAGWAPGWEPAASARRISPRETASTSTPCARISARMWMFEQAFCAKRMVSNRDSRAMRSTMVAASYTHSGVANRSAKDQHWAGENRLDMGQTSLLRCLAAYFGLQAFLHGWRDELVHLAGERGDFAHEGAADELVLVAGGEEHGLDLGHQAAVHAGELEFVVEVGHGAQAAHHGFDAARDHVIAHHAPQPLHPHPPVVLDCVAHHLDALVERKQGLFVMARRHGHDHALEQLGGPAHHVFMA